MIESPTPPPEDDPPAEEDASEEAPAKEPDSQEPAAPAPARRRGQRRRYEKAARERLVDWDFMQAPDDEDELRVRVSGGSVSDDGGNAEFIGESIKRIARLLSSLADATPRLTALRFAHSVDLVFEPSEEEVDRAAEARREAGREPAVEDEAAEKQRQKLLAEAIPDTLVAGVMVAELLQRGTEAPVETALEYGTGVAEAFGQLARFLAADDVSVELVPPAGEDELVISSADAAQIADGLREEGELKPRHITAVGVLSAADGDRHRFRLRLDKESTRHPLLRGKSIVEGEYSPSVGVQIRDLGLWNKEVKARVRVASDPRGGNARIRSPRFRLVGVEPRYGESAR